MATKAHDVFGESMTASAKPGPEARRIIDLDHRYVSPSYTRPYPLAVRRAEGAIVEDADGFRYLDFNAGLAVVSAGHCHPKVVEAIRRQAGELIHMSGSDFYYEGMPRLAEKLAASVPGDRENKVFFCNSGTEAVEAALKLSRYATGRDKIIAFHGAFHGRTLGALSLTASKPVQRKGFGPLVPGVIQVPYPDSFHRPHGMDLETYGATCAQAIEQLFKSGAPIAEETAAIFVEPVLGEGGYVIPPASFLLELRRIADQHGILLIFDEVQSGMGRTGRLWACEHFGVTPDIVVTAKGIAGGMPLGAIIAPSNVMTWPPGAHGSTFGGNPVSIAAALAVWDLLENELIENASRVGRYIMDRIQEWPTRYSSIGDVRGLGLMIGIEFVAGEGTKIPDPGFRDHVAQQAFRRGLIVVGCGTSVLRLSPPLIISQEQADQALDVLEECIESGREGNTMASGREERRGS